jgi:hypothetical protein
MEIAMTMTRGLGLGLVLGALLALTGCIKVDQTLTLNADGTGTLALRYGMSEQTLAQLKAMEQMAAQAEEGLRVEQETPFEFDPEQVRAEFEADKPDGVELTALSSEVVDGWKYIDLTVAFDDIRALKRTELFEDSELGIERLSNGHYLITQRGGGDEEMPSDMEGQALMQQMATMLAGFRIVQTIVVPGDILDSNATAVDGRRASWVFDIAEDPNVLTKLNQTDLTLTFAGDGVKLPPVSP